MRSASYHKLLQLKERSFLCLTLFHNTNVVLIMSEIKPFIIKFETNFG